ncbi:PIN domain-containing protein [Candidatus Micrarchaeota archaeon]|nr:PIN domain-containing protein [Candidatus Micrarchaeota archaeon]
MLLDTSAWIEYFKGTEKGQKVKDLLLDSSIVIYFCPVTIAEISNWCYKNNELPWTQLNKLKNLAVELEITDEILIEAGRIHFEQRKTDEKSKISLVDCLIYSTAAFHGLKLLTKDDDFKNLVDVVFL